MSDAQNDIPRGSKLPLITVVARVVTFVSALVSAVVMKTNNSDKYSLRYKDLHSYRYALFTMVVGFAYSLLLTPFAIYYLRKGKLLINQYVFLQFQLFGDQVNSIILATGVGATFGATSDLSRAYSGEKFGDFFSMAYLSAGFLLIATLSSGVSSVTSSLTLSKRG